MKYFIVFLKGFIKGILIGAGAILPGISSGVLCVALGIYEKLINSILTFFSDFKENIKFLFPIATGIIIGVVIFGNLLKFLFTHYNTLAKICFAILILSSLPSIIKKTEVKKIKLKHILACLLTFSFSIFLISLENYSHINSVSNGSFASFVIAGLAMSAGVIIPGVSSTIILMLLGKYDTYLSAISSLNFSILIPMGIGLCIGSIFLLFLINFFLNKFRDLTYFAIIGFILGSLPVLI